MRRLLGLFSYPWICFEYFNEILNLNEKIEGGGGSGTNLNTMADFKEAVEEC